MRTFETGKTYSCGSIGDHNCIWSFKVVKRTSKTITIESEDFQTVRRAISIYDNGEVIHPLSKYSMAPILRA